MDLDELRRWYGRLRSELDDSQFEVTWQAPIPNRPKQSAWLGLEGLDGLGALTVWDSGEAQLQLAEVATDEVLEVTDEKQLAWAVARMKAWVTGEGMGSVGSA